MKKKITCGYCKKQIKKNSKECSYCGKKFKVFEKKVRRNIALKKIFLTTLIIALSISALIGAFVLLIGEFGETEAKLLATTLSIGGFSIAGLCASIWYDRRKFLLFSLSGIITSILGLFYSIILIWEIVEADSFNVIKPLLIPRLSNFHL